MEKILQQILGEVQGLSAGMTELKSDVATLKTDVAELKSDVATLKTDVAKLTKRVDRIEERQEAIFKETGGLMEFRTEVFNRFSEMDTNLYSIHEMLGDHDIAIRTLRRKYNDLQKSP